MIVPYNSFESPVYLAITLIAASFVSAESILFPRSEYPFESRRYGFDSAEKKNQKYSESTLATKIQTVMVSFTRTGVII